MSIGKFSEFYVDVTKDATKIPQEQYLAAGRYPIIDQGQKSIAGMWDNPDGLYEKVPAIVFGDHTRTIKYVDTPFFIGADGVKVLRPVQAGDNVKYLFYVLQAARIPNLGYSRHFKVVKELKIRMYPRKKQDEIVRVLEHIDSLLEQRQNEILQMDQLVKSRFVELFGALDANPYNWEISKLNNFCDLQNGYAFKSGDYVESSGVLNCRMSNIRPDGGFDSEYHPKFLPNEFWDQYREYRLNDGDVIIAMTDMASDPKILGVPTIVRTNGKRFLLNQRVGKLTFYNAERINNVYLMFVLSQKNIRQQLVKKAGGSTQINVGKPAILGIEFLVPPIELQEQFAAFVAEVDKSKLAVKQSLEKLETLKKSLMQQYFG